jgi:hypothetical protein
MNLYLLKIFLLFQLFLTISLPSFCQQDSINDNYLNLAVLKVGYYDHTLKCAAINYYNLCTNCSNDTLPFNVELASQKDFDRITFTIQNNNDTVFDALMVWFGSGCIYYPINDCYDTTCFLTSPYIPTNSHVQKPSYIDYFSWEGKKVTQNPSFIQNANYAWYAIDSLLITNQFSEYDFKVGIFEFERSEMAGNGIYAPNWIVFLYYNPIITKNEENKIVFNDLKLYPNPASDRLVLSYSKDLASNLISIYSMQGQLLLQEKIKYSQHSYDIDLKSLKEGMYILKLQSDECTLTSRFIKE